MVAVKIDETLKERCPDAALGLLQAKVAVAPDPEEFLALLNGKIAELSEVELSQANKRDKIQTTRKAYKALGRSRTAIVPPQRQCAEELQRNEGCITSITWWISIIIFPSNRGILWGRMTLRKQRATSAGCVRPKARHTAASARMC